MKLAVRSSNLLRNSLSVLDQKIRRTTSFAVRRNVALFGEYCPMPIHLHIYEIDYIDYTKSI